MGLSLRCRRASEERVIGLKVCAIGLVAGLIGALAGCGDNGAGTVRVPDVSGLQWNLALAELCSAELGIAEPEFTLADPDDERLVKAGLIALETRPPVESEVSVGETVTLVVNRPIDIPVSVPDLSCDSLDEARVRGE